MTPTGRSLLYLRRQGWQVAVVESWVPRLNVRRDLWGFADLLAVHPRDGLFLLVQVTTASHAAHRLNKARSRPELLSWLRAGGRFAVHGWARRGDRWTVRVVEVRTEDLKGIVLESPQHRRTRKNGRQRDLFAPSVGDRYD